MNKIVFTIIAIVVLNLAPLAVRPELLLHYKTVVLVIAAAMLWLSQPAFSTHEAKSNRTSDKFSIIIILLMSSVSVVAAVVEWAYYTDTEKSSLLLTTIGAAMLVTGIAVRVWAINVLGKHFTATATVHNDHQLIQHGPYKVVRHPSYSGAFLAIIGCAFFLNAPAAIIIAAMAMAIAYYVRITVEEKMLSSFFGPRFNEYKQKTKRFIPFVW